MSSGNVLIEAGRLAAEGRPFVLATVVQVVRPASTRLGDRALVKPDGELVGWVGGACSEPAVVREALRALADGEARVVRIEGGCASEGVVEVLVEPQVPAPLLAVVGESPAAATLAELARTVGWRVETASVERADAVVDGLRHDTQRMTEHAVAVRRMAQLSAAVAENEARLQDLSARQEAWQRQWSAINGSLGVS
ncbi:MAG: XdhC family protein, partial [Gaiellaceae bacterium]